MDISYLLLRTPDSNADKVVQIPLNMIHTHTYPPEPLSCILVIVLIGTRKNLKMLWTNNNMKFLKNASIEIQN